MSPRKPDPPGKRPRPGPRNRIVPLVIIALTGAFLGWHLGGGEESSSPKPASAPGDRPSQSRVASVAATPAESRVSETVTFRLPKVSPPISASAPEAKGAFEVPRNWLLRGSASKNYQLRSDREVALAGNHSALLASLQTEVQPNLSGSAVQAVLASPYVGTRLELSAALRAEDSRRNGSLWVYVTDPSRVVVAYQIVQMAQDHLPGQWQRYRIVMDVPWNAEVIAYGFSVQGKGRLWVDDVRFSPVDTHVPLTSAESKHQLGVIAQAVSVDGALANPANLDFEDVQVTRERPPGPPPDEIRGTRF